MSARSRRAAAVLAWTVALTALLLWPIVRSGQLLGHDMVFTARQPLNLASVGVSSAPPRAVPLDAVVALAERIVGAGAGRLALVLPLIAAGVGVAAVLRGASLAGRLTACTVAIWNPFVTERLGLGHWALLWAYAALPWLVVAVLRGRGRGGWAAGAVPLAAASIAPTGGLIAAITAVTLVVGLRRPRREVAGTAALAVALQLPWLVPAFASTAARTSDPRGVAAFAARSEHAGGPVLSLLGGGGIWDADVVPASRAGVLPWLWLLLLAGAAVYGFRPLAALTGTRAARTLAALAGAGLLLALLPSMPGGESVVRAAVRHVPGAGLVRDAQKWVLPLVMLEALLAGAAAGRAARRAANAQWRALIAVAGLALPLILLPDAAATIRPVIDPVHYPHDWRLVSDRLHEGDAAVLPWGSYRTFPWAPGRSVLDPAPRLLPVTTVVDDRLTVSGQTLSGENRRAARVQAALSEADLPAALAREGIRWVVVEHRTPGRLPNLSGLVPVLAGRDVSLFRVPGTVRSARPAPARVVAVLAGDGVAVLALLIVLVGAAAGRRHRADRRGADTTKDPHGPATPLI